jgi:hypothetical protein
MSQLWLSSFTAAKSTHSILLANMGSNHVRLPETSSETVLVDQTQRAFARRVHLAALQSACGEEEEGLTGQKSGLTALLLWRGCHLNKKQFSVDSSRSPYKLLSKSGLCPPKFHRCFCKFAIMAHAHRSRRWQVDGGQVAGRCRQVAGKWQANARGWRANKQCSRLAGGGQGGFWGGGHARHA